MVFALISEAVSRTGVNWAYVLHHTGQKNTVNVLTPCRRCLEVLLPTTEQIAGQGSTCKRCPFASRKTAKSESIVITCSMPVYSAAHTSDASARSIGRSAYFFIKSCTRAPRVSEINYFQRAIAHQGNDFHCLADGNVVSDFGEHRPSRDELALEKLEVFDESLMMPVALVHQRDQWAGVNENSLPCHVASPSGICCDVRQGQPDPQNILRAYVRMPLQRTNR